MANYKETTISATSWVRASYITIQNQLGVTPYISFQEEEVFQAGSSVVTRSPNSMTFPPVGASFADPTTQFSLVHPVTGVVLGSAKYLDIQVMIYSLYMHLAKVRDTAAAASAAAAVAGAGPTPAPAPAAA